MRQRLKFPITLVALAPLIAFGLVMIGMMGMDERNRAKELLLHTAESAAAVVEREIAAEIGALETLATSPHLDNGELSAFRAQAERILAVRSDWYSVTVDRPDHQLIHTGAAPYSDPPSSDADTTAEVFKAARPTVTGIIRGRPDIPAPFFVIRVPVIRNGHVHYSLSTLVDARTVHKALRNHPVAEGGRILVLNRQRQIITHFDPARDLTRELDDHIGTDPGQPFRDALEQSAGAFFYAAEFGDVDRLNARAALTRSDWTVVASAPISTVEQPLRRTLAVAMAGGIGALLLSGWLGTMLARAIARRHEAERRVLELEAERRFKDVAAQFPGLVYRRVQEPDGRIRYSFLGSGTGALAGTDPVRCFSEYLLPPDRERWREIMHRSSRTLEPFRFEGRITVPDGRTRWIRSAANTRRAPDGSVFWDGIVLDITDMKEAEGQLRDSESMLRLAQEAAHAGSYDWDVTTDQCRWSEEYARLFGVQGEAAGYDTWLRLIHRDDRAAIENTVGEALDGTGERVSLSYRMVHPERGIRWIESHHRIIRDDDGRPLRMVGINLDITNRRMAEIRLKLAHEAADIATWEWDLRTGENRPSEEHTRQCGLPPEAGPLSFETWLNLLHPDDRDAMQATAARFVDGVFEETEFRLIQPDGSIRWFVTKGRVFRGGDGSPSHVLGMNIDITGRKRAETALMEAKAEAERADAAKSRFLAAASHDLRQPVQSMFLFSSILTAKVREPTAAKVVAHLSKSLEALKAMLDGMLDISRLDAGAVIPEIARVPLHTLLDQIDIELAPIAAAKGIGWRIEDCAVHVRTDPTLLSRILRNLCQNAIRYTAQGSVSTFCTVEGDRVRITVRDTGIGIPPDRIGAIFEEFVQVRGDGRDRDQGLGLGLAIVNRLARLLDHPVQVRSTPGEGTVFTIDVPLVSTPALPGPIEAEADADGFDAGGRLALIVDDDAFIRLGLAAALADFGYEVVDAASGAEALRKLGGRTPAVILSDYRLRDGETGIDVIGAVRALCGPVRAILLTGDVTGPDRAGTDIGILNKPVSTAELRNALAADLPESGRRMRNSA
jgi:PAS domain S-box-containing protein